MDRKVADVIVVVASEDDTMREAERAARDLSDRDIAIKAVPACRRTGSRHAPVSIFIDAFSVPGPWSAHILHLRRHLRRQREGLCSWACV